MTKCVLLVAYFQKHVHRTSLKPIIKNNNNNNNNNSFRMVPTSFFIIYEKLQNLPDVRCLSHENVFDGKREREDRDASLKEESSKHLSKSKKSNILCPLHSAQERQAKGKLPIRQQGCLKLRTLNSNLT